MVNRGSEVNPIIGFFKKENKLVLALIGVVLAGWIGLFALVASSISSDTGTSVSEDKTGTETTLAAESSLTVDNDEDMTENPSLDPIVSAPVTEESTMEEDSLIIDSIVSAESVTTDVAEDSSSGEESGIADTEAETGDDNGYTFTEMAVVMYASSGLNVRDLPDKNGNSLGKLEQNEKISVTGQCNETNWYRIDYSGQTAYVSNEFVSSAPKEEDQPKTTQKTGDGDAVVATGGNDNSGSGSSGGGGSNFVTYDNPEQQQTSASYVLNTSTMKFHLPNCNSVKKIAPQNYATANNRADIMAQGYQPCKNCNP